MHPDSLPVERVPHGGSEDSELLDFSANVNPRRPPGISPVYDCALGMSRSYPADDYTSFRTAAGEYVGCDPASIVPTAGGLGAIRLAVGTTLSPGDTALVPTPSFSEYEREVRIAGGDPKFVPYDDVLAADPGPHSLAIVCNPNNPTGEAYDPDELRAFAERCRESDTTLLVDEAFLGFTDRPTLAGEEGVVVARSLTKLFGIPGLRVGFAVATGANRDAMESARRPWNLGTPAMAVGEHCMKQAEFVRETRERVRHERERMQTELVQAFTVYPSDAPFILLGIGSRDVDRVVSALRERSIAVRDATTFRGLDSHIRVAVRLPDENDRLLEALHGV